MKAKKNSIQAKLYRWFYGKDVTQMPKALCSYGRLVVLMYVLLLPTIVASFPVIILPNTTQKALVDQNSIVHKIIMGLILWFCVSIVVSMFIVAIVILNGTAGIIFNDNAGICKSIGMLGIIGWMIFVLFLIVKPIVWCVKKYKGRVIKDRVEKTPSVIGSYFKAIHDKVCPPIEWID